MICQVLTALSPQTEITPTVSALVFFFFSFFLVCSDICALLLNCGATAASLCQQCRNGVWHSTACCSGSLLCQMQISHYQKSANTHHSHTHMYTHITMYTHLTNSPKRTTFILESFLLTGPHPSVMSCGPEPKTASPWWVGCATAPNVPVEAGEEADTGLGLGLQSCGRGGGWVEWSSVWWSSRETSCICLS